MRLKFLFFFFPIFALSSPILACTCDNVTPFFDSINSESLVVRIEILKHGLLPVDEIKQYFDQKYIKNQNIKEDIEVLPPPFPFDYDSYTLIKVIDDLGTNKDLDTLIFFNGAGSMCLGSLSQLEIGANFILKVQYSNEKIIELGLKEHLSEGELDISDWEGKKIFSSGICNEWLLTIKGELVRGNILENRRSKLVEELNQKRSQLSILQIEQMIQRIQKTKPEEMTYYKFVELMKNR